MFDIYNINQPHAPIAMIEELTEAAFAVAIDRLAGHKSEVVAFEIDLDHPDHAAAFTARGEVYQIEPCEKLNNYRTARVKATDTYIGIDSYKFGEGIFVSRDGEEFGFRELDEFCL